MRRALRPSARLTLLLSLAIGVALPDLTVAQEEPDGPRPSGPPPATAQPQPPPMTAPPPGYAPPPSYPPGYAPPPYSPYGPQYRPEAPVRYEERRMIGLSIAGFSIFGGMYMFTAMGGYLAEKGWLAVPVIGPWGFVDEDRRSRCSTPPSIPGQPPQQPFCASEDSSTRLGYALLVVDGLIQAGGLAMGILGAVIKRKVAVREPRYSFLPQAGPGGVGLAVRGHF